MFVSRSRPNPIREEARKLRREEQLSIDQLADRFGRSRSTMYKWVRDLRIPGGGPGGGFSKEAALRGSRTSASNWRRKRDRAYQAGLETFAIFRDTPQFRDFVAAYFAGGYVRDDQVVAFTHAEPALVRLAHSWFNRMGTNKIRYELQMDSSEQGAAARKLWAAHLGIKAAQIQFLKRPRNVVPAAVQDGQPHEGEDESPAAPPLSPIRLVTTDTMLRSELQAWMDCALAEWS